MSTILLNIFQCEKCEFTCTRQSKIENHSVTSVSLVVIIFVWNALLRKHMKKTILKVKLCVQIHSIMKSDHLSNSNLDDEVIGMEFDNDAKVQTKNC